MKRVLLVLVLLLVIGCSVETDDSSGVVAPSGDVSVELSDIYQLNELSDEFNLLKMYETCYDASVDTVYAVGIMTDTVGYYKNGRLGYIETGLGVGSFELKDLECGDGYLLVSTEKQVLVYEDNVLVETLDYKNTIFGQGVDLLDEYFIVPVTELETFNVYSLETFEKVFMIEQGLGDWYSIDGEIVYVNMKGESKISYYDSSSFELLREEEVNVPCSYSAVVYDESQFWYLCEDSVYVDGTVITGIVPEADQIYYSEGYVSVVTGNGFDDGTVGGYLGGVTVIDVDTKEVLYELELEHHHKRSSADGDYLFMTSNDDNSVVKLELKSGEYETLEFGNSAEHGVVLKDGSVMVANRLGGSTLFHIKDGNMVEIDVGEWPVGLVYDSDLDRAFSFDFLAGRISVVDPSLDEVVDQYYVGYEAETDAIGHLGYDSVRKLLYAIIPEQNEVVVLDALNGDIFYTIEVEDRSDDYMDMGGAAILDLVVHEESGNVFLYVQKTSILYLYDEDYSLVKQIKVDCVNDIKDFPYSLFVDNYHDKIYSCGNVFSYDGKPLGFTDTGYTVYAVDDDDGLLFTVDLVDEQEELVIMDTEYNELARVNLGDNQYVKARFAYDQVNNKLYVFYMVLGEVWEYEVQIESLINGE
tara:strand:+ start:76 stop:1998 length:1923 start_codon:yes stop_codon:yes gene_type:complete